ncbi:hypothetical protein [Bradyrhizobium vignae]|uniref:hypothetical protein n=1 Tax=Bradyrhizobium TaxID=374 RepID=UPI00100BE316|nr:hypothetical protein [Bradyrhizobium vignae]RXG88296.1 hypothetical protein EAV90_31175 [Bradyrhizobium vignae]
MVFQPTPESLANGVEPGTTLAFSAGSGERRALDELIKFRVPKAKKLAGTIPSRPKWGFTPLASMAIHQGIRTTLLKANNDSPNAPCDSNTPLFVRERPFLTRGGAGCLCAGEDDADP